MSRFRSTYARRSAQLISTCYTVPSHRSSQSTDSIAGAENRLSKIHQLRNGKRSSGIPSGWQTTRSRCAKPTKLAPTIHSTATPSQPQPVLPVPTTEHIKGSPENSIMLRANIPEDQEFTAAAQQLTEKSLKILETAKCNNYTVKLRCDAVVLSRYGVLINFFHCNRDVTMFALSYRLG
jgi:hypothetical protein